CKDSAGIRVKNMRTVFVNENAVLIVEVVGIPANMRSLVNYENALIELRSEALRDHAAGKAGAHYEKIEHCSGYPYLCRRFEDALACRLYTFFEPPRGDHLVDEMPYADPGSVPGHVGQKSVGTLNPVVVIVGERELNGGDEFTDGIGDAREALLTVRTNDV